MGVVRTTFIINPEGKIAAVWNKVNVRKKKKVNGETIEVLHAHEVQTTLQQLQAN